MQDPFADKSNSKLQREVQIWMAGLACLLIAFMYLAVKRMAGSGDEIPAHILQSGVAHVTAPIEHDPDAPQLLKPPKLMSVPAISANRFSSKSISTPVPDSKNKSGFSFPNHRKPTATFTNAAPKPAEATRSRGDRQFAHPQPTFTAPAKLKSALPDVDADAEALGRRRAKQLAAMTSGLPKRLNQIQSSIKQASAELPVDSSPAQEDARPENNGLVPVKSFPAQPIAIKSIVKAPTVGASIAPQPIVESSHPVIPLVAKAPKIKPIRQPDRPPTALVDSQTRVPASPISVEPAKVTEAANAFRPLATPAFSDTTNSLPVAKSIPATEPTSAPAVATKTVADSAMQELKPLRPAVPKKQIKPIIVRSQQDRIAKQHVVVAGDSFFTIAQQHYGDGQWFRALRSANQALIASHDGLQAGMSLSIPSTEELARQFPDQAFQAVAQQPTEAQRRIYVTQAGDTLFDIARRKIGQGSRFSDIIRANEFSLPAQIRASDELPADLRLVLPESSL